jgi:nicotinate-nucleotide adenylyltransferase
VIRTLLVFGGTFDPPHARHVQMARLAADAVGADGVLVVPAAVNPQRTGTPPSPAEHRLAMVRRAFAADPRAWVDDREIRRGGPSFTVDTLESIAREHPGARLRLLLGGDQALNFASWRLPERIEALAEPVVVPRPPLDAASLRRELTARTGGERWTDRVLPEMPVDVRSTELRATLAEGRTPSASLLDPAVADYALANRLYRASTG